MPFILSSCGKRRPPLPPAPPRHAINYLSAVQRGNRIILKITIPPAHKAVKQISIYRLNESLSSQTLLSEDDFASRSTLIGIVEPLNSAASKTVYYEDVLSSSAPANRLRYAVRLVYPDGRRSAFSNFLMIEPSLQIPLPPVLSNPVVGQSAVHLEWQKPETNLDSSKPVNLASYNVYRTQSGGVADKNNADEKNQGDQTIQLLNSTPITENTFNDQTFEFGKSYQYFIRAVAANIGNIDAMGRNAVPPIESLDSNRQIVTPRDTFAPAAPQNLTIAAAPNRLSLFFATNTEPDLAGYLVYRASNQQTPLSEWRKLTVSPLTTNTFQDTAVESGQRYYYYLKAIDNAGNISAPSEIVSETAP